MLTLSLSLIGVLQVVMMYYMLLNHDCYAMFLLFIIFFFFQAEDGIRDQPRSRGLGDVYKRQDYWGI